MRYGGKLRGDAEMGRRDRVNGAFGKRKRKYKYKANPSQKTTSGDPIKC